MSVVRSSENIAHNDDSWYTYTVDTANNWHVSFAIITVFAVHLQHKH